MLAVLFQSHPHPDRLTVLSFLQPFIYTILSTYDVSFPYPLKFCVGWVVGGKYADGCFFFFLPQSQTQGSPNYPSFVESVDEYQFVERLLPPTRVPDPPKREHYPTPSGWQPPRGELDNGDGLKATGKYPSLVAGLPQRTLNSGFGTCFDISQA